MVNDITSQILELEKASRRSAIFGGFGLTVVAFSLAISTLMLHRATAQLTRRGHEVDALHSELESGRKILADAETMRREARLESENLATDLQTKTDELTSALERLDEIRRAIAESASPDLLKRLKNIVPPMPREAGVAVALNEAVRVQMSAAPTTETLGKHALHEIRIWLEMPNEWAGRVLKAQYFFDDPSVSTKLKTSFDSTKHFEIRYKGWSCVETVKVTIFERTGGQSEIPFNMCSAASSPMLEPTSAEPRP